MLKSRRLQTLEDEVEERRESKCSQEPSRVPSPLQELLLPGSQLGFREALRSKEDISLSPEQTLADSFSQEPDFSELPFEQRVAQRKRESGPEQRISGPTEIHERAGAPSDPPILPKNPSTHFLSAAPAKA